MSDRDRGPDVKFPPPLLFVAGLGAGVLLDRAFAWRPLHPEWLGFWLAGGALVVVGLAVMFTGILTFRRFRTAVYPNRPAKLVVDTGIYARTRNPMYLGLTLFYVGAALLLNSRGALTHLPLVLALLHSQVIRREERHLRERFPDAYADYCERVPRWF